MQIINCPQQFKPNYNLCGAFCQNLLIFILLFSQTALRETIKKKRLVKIICLLIKAQMLYSIITETTTQTYFSCVNPECGLFIRLVFFFCIYSI